MTIEQFVSNNNVLKCNALVDINVLEKAEKEVDVKFGEELKEYLLKYGYLIYDGVELYGINSRQGLNSDMIKQTLYLHKYYPETVPYVALEDRGEAHYFLLSSEDKVYEYMAEEGELLCTELSLFEYIIQRFQNQNS